MFKRDLKLFFKCLVSGSVLLIILTVICLGAAAVMSAADTSDKLITVAVVDNEDSVLSRILINTIMNTDYLSRLLNAEKADETTAMRMLANKEAAAVFILPDGFLDDIYAGRESYGKVYLSSALAAQADIVHSAINFGEKLLISGQNGVFAAANVLRENRITGDSYSTYMTHVNTRILAEALAANDRYFTVETVDCGTHMTSEGHYMLCWTVFFLIMISLFFVPLFLTDRTHALLARLTSLGVTDVQFMTAKLFLMFAARLIIILSLVPFGIVQASTSAQIIGILLCSAFLTLICACLSMCIRDPISAMLITAVSGIFLSGGLIPPRLLPSIFAHLASFTPYGAAKSLLAPVFNVSPDLTGTICALLYSALAMLLISRNLRAVRIGGGAND